MLTQTPKAFCLIALLFVSGCASYAHYTGDFREGLARKDYDGVLHSLDRSRKGPNQLLYFMEKGLIDHYRGNYPQSNIHFEQAERLANQLFTRSISREVASLVTNDAIRDYRGEDFELIFINYYRALNYWRLRLPEDALVECRKANVKLARYAAAADYDAAYRNDAFIHYMTGLFYEATGELNDAYVSYRDAQKAYRAYAGTFGVSPPPSLTDDLVRVAGELGYRDDVEGGNGSLLPRGGELVLFCETGFVPRKVQKEISLPIFDDDVKRGREGDLDALSRQIAGRYHTAYPRDLRLKYWLRVALPACQETVPSIRCIRLTASGHSAQTVLAEDLSAIAHRTFQDRYPVILTRTVARGMAKYLASEAVEKKNKYLGFFANLFTASTEAADTRGWLSLPHSIQIGRLRLPAGVHDLTVESLDAQGQIVETKVLPGVEIREGARTFLSCRTYR